MKSNPLARLVGRFHQLPNRLENCGDLLVVSLDSFFKLGQLAGEFPVRGEHLAQLHKRPHDLNVQTARLLRNTLESMATPCSVKA